MYARATSFAVSSRMIRYASMHNANLLKIQDEISSGIKITKSSDNPLAFRQITALETNLQQLGAAGYVINEAQSKLNVSVSQLQEFHRLLADAKRIAQEGVQSLSPADRNALALEAEGVLTQMKQIANSEFTGQFLYGGARSDKQPYSFGNSAIAGRSLDVNYAGVDESGQSVISAGIQAETLYSGPRIFDANNRSATVIYGKSGAQVGSGTDSLKGRADLQIRHTLTTYQGASGIQTGTSSAAKDTVIGQVGKHQLNIVDTSGTGAFGTISLNGGPAIAFNNTMTDLEVAGSTGEKVFVNTTAIAAGFNGNVDLTGAGTFSVDNGASTTNIDFSANQIVTDAATGKLVTINSTNVSRTGDDHLDFPGTSNAFQTVHELIQDLRGTRTIDSSQFAESLGRRMNELDSLGDRVLVSVGLQSTTLEGLRRLQTRNEDLTFEIQSQLSGLQSTDIAEAVVRLRNEQNLQQYTYLAATQIMSQSLIDFLR